MRTNRERTMLYTRRDMGKLALASVPLGAAFGAAKLNSEINGVKIGVITYSFRNSAVTTVDEIIAALTKIGLSECELMSDAAEADAGAPKRQPMGGRGAGAPAMGARPPAAAQPGAAPAAPPQRPAGAPMGLGAGAPRINPPMTEEQIATARTQPYAVELRNWRTSVSMDKYAAVRKKFEDAGIRLSILCFNMGEAITDEEMDYAFKMGKALGAKSLSTSTKMTVAKRLGPVAEHHKMLIGFHGHDNNADPNETGSLESYAKALSYGKYNGVNLDIGHFTSANYDALKYIEENHARITNLHIKDRKKDHGPNMTLGQGDTPIKDVLKLVQKKKLAFPCNIELEYRIPEGSDAVTEVTKCFDYIKQALA